MKVGTAKVAQRQAHIRQKSDRILGLTTARWQRQPSCALAIKRNAASLHCTPASALFIAKHISVFTD
jgi:hypothetical protein